MKAGLGAGIFGLTYVFGALVLPRATVGDPFAPIVYPILLGVLLTVFGVISLILGIKKQNKEGKFQSQKFVVTPTGKLIVISCVAGVIYAIVFDKLGYVISTSLFMGTILFALNGKDKWKVNVLVSIIFSVGIYFLFSELLSIPLPRLPILDI